MANRASERRTRGSAAGGLDVSKVPVGLDHGPQLIWYEVVNQDRHDGSLSYPAERSETASKRNPIWCTAPDHPSPAGPVSIEFVEEAPDDDTPRLGAWLEPRAQDPQGAACHPGRRASSGGAPGPPYYLHGTGRPGVHHRCAVISHRPAQQCQPARRPQP
jgi:hypothetical protein